jgi:predicted CopG family antitoxin
LKEGITNRISERTTITLDNNVYSRLKKQGTFGESFSSLVSRILDQIEGGEQP